MKYPHIFLLLLMAGCTKDEPLLDFYNSAYSGTVTYHSSTTISGVTTTNDSTYSETIILSMIGEDSLNISSPSFGERKVLMILHSTEYITYGSAYSFSYYIGSDFIKLEDHSFSGGAGGFGSTVDRSLSAYRD